MVDVSPFTKKEKIQILLAEYATLRAEILQRNSVLTQVFTVGGLAIIAILSFAVSRYDLLTMGIGIFLLIFLVAPLAFFVLKTVEFDTLAAAKRIRQIESAINKIAGERLLVWETDNGLYKVGYRDRINYLLGRGNSN